MAEEAPPRLELSDAEKDKIRAEMDYRAAIAALLAPPEPPKPPGHGFFKGLNGSWTALNQPLIITVLGGLLLSIVGARLQENSSGLEREKTRAAQMQDKKYELLASSSTSLDKYTNTLWNSQGVMLWLGQKHAATDLYHGRSLSETKKLRDAISSTLQNQPSADVSLNEIEALFVCPDVTNAAETLRRDVGIMEMTDYKNEDQIDHTAEAVNRDMTDLAKAMGGEIKGECDAAKEKEQHRHVPAQTAGAG